MRSYKNKLVLYFCINLIAVLLIMGTLLITQQNIIFVLVSYLIIIFGWNIDYILSKNKNILVLVIIIVNIIGIFVYIPFR